MEVCERERQWEKMMVIADGEMDKTMVKPEELERWYRTYRT